jgi:proteasome activator subunit 3 (PA28 gamma)
MIQATPNPSPSSHIFKFTDLSAPLSKNSNVSFESPSKKRKIGNSEVECSTPPVSFASELDDGTHTQVELHKIIKRECEELIELIVHPSIFIPFLSVHSESIQDQAKLWITISLSK